MESLGPAILVIGGIVLFVVLISVIKAVMSRGINKVVDAGMRTVEKKSIAGLEEAIAVPLVIHSSASAPDIMAALDRIVNAKKTKPGFAQSVYESARAADKIEYSMGNQLYPQQLVVEVRFGERDGMTQVVFKCLHITEKDGIHIGAGPLMSLRRAVKYAAEAAGDEAKIAEGVRRFGPPEPGSPRAIRQRNRKVLIGVAAVLVIIPALLLKRASGGTELLLLGMLVAGGVTGFTVWKMEMNPGDDFDAEGNAESDASAGPVAREASVGATSDAPPSLDTAKGLFADARAGWDRLSPNNKLIAVGALLAVLAFAGFAVSRVQEFQASVRENIYAIGADGASAEDEAYDQATVDESAVTADDSQDPETADGTSSDSTDQAQYHFAQDITQYGPTSGGSTYASVTFVETPENPDLESMLIDSETVGAPGTDELWTVHMSSDDFGSPAVCYIDEKAVSGDELYSFIHSRASTSGSIYFTHDGIATFKAYNDANIPADYVGPEGGDI